MRFFRVFLIAFLALALVPEPAASLTPVTEIMKLTWRAEAGDVDAQFELGEAYQYGLEVAPNHANAVKWYRQAADQGHARAQVRLGKLALDGLGMPQSDEKAAKWFTAAARQGLADGQFELALLHIHGWGVKRDLEMAALLFRRAANHGHYLSQGRLAEMYEKGAGVPRNLVEAYILYAITGDEAGKRRLAPRLSPAQFREAERRAEAWIANRKK